MPSNHPQAPQSTVTGPSSKPANQDFPNDQDQPIHQETMGSLLRLAAAALISTTTITSQARAQTFSNFVHDCAETGYNEDYTSVTGLNCAFNVTNKPFPPESFLNLDNCLSFDSQQLVGGQGGGYTAFCRECSGTSTYYFACTCGGNVTASIDLNSIIGVDWTDGSICCDSGTMNKPHVSCGTYGA
ncbi:hypothetical protein BD289DRAFT_210974 [Coniella lustricola]|uniref:Cyanovirin-N domain-containing protein n=1 Tax=Coniella lustricola TaxID=2025994 RepID=A0A2T3ABU6_9PEZI|nr:hypothetical protein BD289DRAFT_210974 [Coniella lustricola]